MLTLVGCLMAVAMLYGLFYASILTLSNNPRGSLSEEEEYLTTDAHGISEEPRQLESIYDEPELELSVVIPCYNETKRLGVMLEEAVPFLNEKFPKSYEILLVDDGSKDGTAHFALEWAIHNKLDDSCLRVCQLKTNRGKGGAVTHGMKYVRGKYTIFADADGASKFTDVEKLIAAVNKSTNGDPSRPAVAIGSRAHMVKTDAVVKRSFIRNFLMYGLHTLLYVFGLRKIGDTQCGFKLFTRAASRQIFPYMHTEGWIFDVEVLIIAMKKNIPISEVAISWHEVEGSKIELARDCIKMAIDLIVMRCAYFMGIYNETRVSQRMMTCKEMDSKKTR